MVVVRNGNQNCTVISCVDMTCICGRDGGGGGPSFLTAEQGCEELVAVQMS